jgi:large subunit ribosomal protein L18
MTRHDSIKIRHKRIRKKVSGTAERPRLAVNFSGRHIRAQVIDDVKGVTIAAASTQEKAAKAGANVANAQTVGKLVADRAKKKSISKVVFDRGGFQYMGKVKALADAAREAGLEF